MAAATLVVLLKLKPGADPAAYEQWAAETDAPTAKSLPSIAGWNLYAAQGLVGAEGAPPFDYIEVVQVSDTEQMAKDMAGEAIAQRIAELAEFAEPVFVLTRSVV